MLFSSSLVAILSAYAAAHPLKGPSGVSYKLPDHLRKRTTPGQAITLTMKVSANRVITKEKPQPIGVSKNVAQGHVNAGVNATLHDNSVVLSMENEHLLYLAEFCFGNPCQKVELQIDTGSADIWLPGVGSSAQASNVTDHDYGFYDPAQSSSALKTNATFDITYGDGTGASGDIYTDTLALGNDIVLPFASFGVATKDSAGQGLCGFGYLSEEMATVKYDNLPLSLHKAGFISLPSFLIYLDSRKSSTGQLILGAIDTEKYEGQLTTLPILKRSTAGKPIDEYQALFVSMSGVSQGLTKLLGAYDALIDTGTTMIYAPKDVYNVFTKQFTFDSHVSAYTAPCDLSGEPLKFSFGGTTVTVPFLDMLHNISMLDGTFYSVNDKQMCSVGMVESQSDYLILGDIFLRSAYVFVDYATNTLSLSQVRYTTASNLVSI